MAQGDSIYDRVVYYNNLFYTYPESDYYYNTHQTVLGLLALKEGNKTVAYEHMITSAKVKGKGLIYSSGPDTSLAEEFIHLGENEYAFEYFDLIDDFWFDKERIELWKDQLMREEFPDFGNQSSFRTF